jgi:SAM-dependent methyltransferase
MYHLGYYEHYLDLVRKKLPIQIPDERRWTLKEYRSLFVLDTLITQGARRVLEVGPGFDRTFAAAARSLGIEYWFIDRSNDGLGIGRNEARFAEAVRQREAAGARWIDGLLGSAGGALGDAMFDAVFSVSVVEHIPDAAMAGVVAETTRILKPGGCSVHSIDIYPRSTKARDWHIACKKAGLDVPLPYYDVPLPYYDRWEFDGKYTTFLEKPEIRYCIYNANSPGSRDQQDGAVPYVSQFATALHRAFRIPEPGA